MPSLVRCSSSSTTYPPSAYGTVCALQNQGLAPRSTCIWASYPLSVPNSTYNFQPPSSKLMNHIPIKTETHQAVYGPTGFFKYKVPYTICGIFLYQATYI